MHCSKMNHPLMSKLVMGKIIGQLEFFHSKYITQMPAHSRFSFVVWKMVDTQWSKWQRITSAQTWVSQKFKEELRNYIWQIRYWCLPTTLIHIFMPISEMRKLSRHRFMNLPNLTQVTRTAVRIAVKSRAYNKGDPNSQRSSQSFNDVWND